MQHFLVVYDMFNCENKLQKTGLFLMFSDTATHSTTTGSALQVVSIPGHWLRDIIDVWTCKDMSC
jgi:hypothetical protein